MRPNSCNARQRQFQRRATRLITMGSRNPFVVCIYVLATFACLCDGLLYPRDSETRSTKSLDGVWNFRLCPSLTPDEGFEEMWYARPLRDTGPVMDMPVPSSFNDITPDVSIRDFVGWAWYDTSFYTPSTWDPEQVRIILRFDSAHYTSLVWLNGHQVMTHSGGHLPFEADVTAHLQSGSQNLLTVAVNNTLQRNSIPQGYWEWKEESGNYPAGYFTLRYTFDFFNYAGIHRPVTLYTVPKSVRITDVSTTPSVAEDLSQATLAYTVEVSTESPGGADCHVQLLLQNGTLLDERQGCQDSFVVSRPNLWWPNLMHPEPGYLHTLVVRVTDGSQEDRYRLQIGLRQVTWDRSTFKINHKDFYFRGLGMHEDANFRGRGLDLGRVTKDFHLLKWLNANSFRTSHYPYAEEIMDFADRHGIVVIDECPGVNLEHYDEPGLLDNHLQVMRELIARDKNRPSVVMWSIANEPRSDNDKAKGYFHAVANLTRSLDPSRPITLATYYPVSTDQAPYAVDVICINRYASWYTDTGHLELIQRQLTHNIRDWRAKHGKLVMICEYGADTIHGFHEAPSTIFTEEYQTDLMREFFKGFDTLRQEGILIGEMIWNFADFMTRQEYKRAWGNRKGIFTRDRHPKASAHLLRLRYAELAAMLDAAV